LSWRGLLRKADWAASADTSTQTPAGSDVLAPLPPELRPMFIRCLRILLGVVSTSPDRAYNRFIGGDSAKYGSSANGAGR